MLSKLTYLSASARGLHGDLMSLRSLVSTGHALRPFSTASHSAPEPKVLYEQHSPYLGELKLNTPKNLNSLDFDMVHIIM